MRFVLALVSLVLAVVLIGWGIAQRTVLAGPDSLTAAGVVASDAAVTVIDGDTLNARPGLQEINVEGDTIFAAYGRTTDVLAWVGDASYNRIGFDDETLVLTDTLVPGAEDTVPSPVGSDLWLEEYSSEDELRMLVKLDPELSVLLVSNGTEPAPASLSLSWPLNNDTPWAVPALLAGAGMLLLALIFFLWALLHQRRNRGPRRKSIKAARGPRMPKLPRQRSYRVRKPKAIASSRGRRATRRMIVVVPLSLAALVGLSACSAGAIPGAAEGSASSEASSDASTEASSEAPTEAEDVVEEEATSAAATVGQVRDIVRDAAQVASTADAALDGTALEKRFTGPALAARLGNYAVRAKDSAYPTIAPIPIDAFRVILPQVTGEIWPRSMFAVVEAADTAIAPVALTLVQETPREQYLITYAVALEPDAELPDLAPEGIGALPLGPESPLLSTPPSAIVPAYVDVINTGEASASYPLFDIEKDSLLPQLRAGRDQATAELGANGSIEFAAAAGDAELIALSSNEAGALVNVYVTETQVARPLANGTLNSEGAVNTLAGVTSTTKGLTTQYGEQLLFYVPPVGSSEKISLLGFSDALISAKELP